MRPVLAALLPLESLQSTGGGPLYVKLRQNLEMAIRSGKLNQGDALPAERELADYAHVSRVTVRKAVDDLVRDGLLIRRHGSGTFVAKSAMPRVELKLTGLTSFTEEMNRRSLTVETSWLERGLFDPSVEEMKLLGVTADAKIARLGRLRIADGIPLAIEWASISVEFLPDPTVVTHSLYAELAKRDAQPVRAIQRISACNMNETDAGLLAVPPGSAGLIIERISYLASGRVVERTRSLFRGDTYDFVAELSLGETSA